jgi:hypothetical protein
LQTWTVINDKSYDLTYFTNRTNFDTSLALAQQMIDSFQIMGQSNVSPLSSVESTSMRILIHRKYQQQLISRNYEIKYAIYQGK